ncbi:MAG: DUF1573 domain-containing protein [candidate division Zixibacteria bacterium]|nr:DUF1573 domain-containing protein [candidate division Zixibacteria bacterium]MDH3939281.1 DUF1573 domain-containing protein [candidate division Zixibacteria bacterium]MDH4033754.1 DUF1573 domain-containing protein [candidate division Zixibacteria bacterium]
MIKVLLLSILGLTVLFTTVEAGADIEIAEDSFNFGRAAQHAVLSHRFTIASTGDDTLVINKVVPGCGCTKAPLADSVLAPGEKTTLELFFSTKSFRGIVNKSAYIETNISEAKYYIRFQSELLPEPDTIMPIHLSPSRLDVSQFKPEVRRRARFWIHNKDSVDYRIKVIDYADQVFDIKMPEMVPAMDSVWGGVIVKDEAIPTGFEHSVTFELDDGSGIRYSLPIKRMYRVRQ